MSNSTDSLNKQAADFLKNIPIEDRKGVILEIKRRQRVVEKNAMDAAANVIRKAKRR